ncbi:MAG: hypothetical protein JWN71_3357 [Xanthobacteraceae bacterium]|nr:hypothetical protein [Xanthobacteraceae bacterium]
MIVVWRVVDSCNLCCPFCAFDKRLTFGRSAADPSDILRFAHALAAYQARTKDRVMLSWLGGEPLSWKPLQDLTLSVRALDLAVSATTNGTALGNARLRRHIRDAYRELTISVDGFSSLHDSLRGWAGGFAKLRSWIPLLASEARMAGSRLKLRANIVLMRQNVDEFPALCAELAGWGIKEITFNQLGGRDRPEFYPAHRLTPVDVDRLEASLPVLRGELSTRGVVLVGGDGYLSRIRASALDRANPVADCGPGESFLFVDENGIGSPCSFTTADYGVDVRMLQTADDIADLPSRFREMRRVGRSPQCDDCLSTQVCDKFKAPANEPRALPREAAVSP